MDMNVITSYLVQLGAKIDDNSWNEATNKMHQLEKTVNDVTSGMAKSFVGASTAIVGASGSGKSTLLSIMAGLDTPSRGSVRVDGVDLFALNEDQRAAVRGQKMGFVFQSFQHQQLLIYYENILGIPFFDRLLQS